ncbi:sterol desaturase family protein [Henriciella mobilis]|uniref:Sterol desaturase family protein n=2 Tax=Henriciella mobilis TaxID=2305467 RepID=A0A399RL93_9PROT|nr:sterol desaturase family protein [Henriciella mobilis]
MRGQGTIMPIPLDLGDAWALVLRYKMFFITLSVFFGAAVISLIWQWRRMGKSLSLREFLKTCFQPGFAGASSRTDLAMYVIVKLTHGVLVAGMIIVQLWLGLVIADGLTALFGAAEPAEAGFVTIVVMSVVIFLFADFSNFLTHYMQHKIPVLWELHKVHHSATYLSPLTTARMHPLGDLFDLVTAGAFTAIPMGVGVYLYGFDLPELFLMFANANFIGTVLVLDALRHSQFPVSFGAGDCVLMSPHMHQLHHSIDEAHWDKNMGNKLSIFDWIFGTAYKPAQGEIVGYGIGRGDAEDDLFHSLYGAYVRPVFGMARTLIGRRPDLPPPVRPIPQGAATQAKAARPAAETGRELQTG